MVESSLAEQPDRLKETVIGVEVFDRAPDYDCKQDPVVRVEMRRLRSKLREYYGTEGQSDEVVIEVKKGSYIPSLVKRAFTSNVLDSPASASEAATHVPPPALVRHIPDEPAPAILPTRTVTPRARDLWSVAAISLLLAATIMVIALSRWPRHHQPLRLFPLTGKRRIRDEPGFLPKWKTGGILLGRKSPQFRYLCEIRRRRNAPPSDR